MTPRLPSVIAHAILPGSKAGVLIEMSCETEVVARSDGFKAFAAKMAEKVASNPGGVELESDRVAFAQKIDENVRIRRSHRFDVTGHGAVAAYIHTGGQVGVIVEVGTSKEETTVSKAFPVLVGDINLQIAAANPASVDRASIPAGMLERQREIYRGQVPSGRPANVVEKIVDGKIEKFYSGVCLVDQAFIRNPDQTIAQLIAAKGKELGDEIVIRRFLRYNAGEQIAG